MFVGREHELEVLERLYNRGRFQMAVVYGRRRVGKTALLDEFSRDKDTLFFTAQQKSDAINLRSFSQAVYRFFDLPISTGSFATWEDALTFIAERSRDGKPRVFVFDELPYAAQAQPALPSTLQIAIDHAFKTTNVCMIFCGSNEGFMESNVLGKKSPLYGRRNAQIKLAPFDYYDAARLMPACSSAERIVRYAAFGGTPYYLEQVEEGEPLEESLRRLFFDMAGVLYAEPDMLLRQELREPALYSSILDAVAAGAASPKIIADKAGVDEGSVGKYLKTLSGLGLIERVVPLGEGATSRKGVYRIKDPFFAFWYRFVSPYTGAIEAGAGDAMALRASGQELATYVGKQFELVCLQWLMRLNRAGRLPFLASEFGAWWGTDPRQREQVDIDVIAADPRGRAIVFGECKWREHVNETETIETLVRRAELIKGYRDKRYVVFSKHAASEGTSHKIDAREDLSWVTPDDLYDGLEGEA